MDHAPRIATGSLAPGLVGTGSFAARAFVRGTMAYSAFLEALLDGLYEYEMTQQRGERMDGHAHTPLSAA
jgi:hypothetical protein